MGQPKIFTDDERKERDAESKARYKLTEKGRITQRRSAKKRSDRQFAAVGAIKVAAGCCDCGFNAHPAALHFDHVEDNKVAGVGQLMNKKWERIEAEMTKCVVRCANCHAIKTAERRQEKKEGK